MIPPKSPRSKLPAPIWPCQLRMIAKTQKSVTVVTDTMMVLTRTSHTFLRFGRTATGQGAWKSIFRVGFLHRHDFVVCTFDRVRMQTEKAIVQAVEIDRIAFRIVFRQSVFSANPFW